MVGNYTIANLPFRQLAKINYTLKKNRYDAEPIKFLPPGTREEPLLFPYKKGFLKSLYEKVKIKVSQKLFHKKHIYIYSIESNKT